DWLSPMDCRPKFGTASAPVARVCLSLLSCSLINSQPRWPTPPSSAGPQQKEIAPGFSEEPLGCNLESLSPALLGRWLCGVSSPEPKHLPPEQIRGRHPRELALS